MDINDLRKRTFSGNDLLRIMDSNYVQVGVGGTIHVVEMIDKEIEAGRQKPWDIDQNSSQTRERTSSMNGTEWMIASNEEQTKIELSLRGDKCDYSPDLGDGTGIHAELTPWEAEVLGSQLVRRARENGAEPWIMDRGSSIHEEGACLVLLDERERAMISNAFFKGRKKNKAVAALLKKVRWMI